MKRNIAIATPSLGDEEWQATKTCFDSGWLTTGPQVSQFEKAFAEYHQVKSGIGTTSCTTGLHLMLSALNIGPGDEVIVPAFTWVSTANVVLHCGATPVFVDVDIETYNIDPYQVQQKISSKTKAVIVVHLFGLCADMDAIRDAVPSHVRILEDAACASGASYNGTFAGGLGDAASFSFHPRKIITTGEGGMVTTQNQELAEKIVCLRNHGASVSEEQRHNGPKPYILPEFDELGFNYRMTDMQGAIGCVQLTKLRGLVEQRNKMAAQFRDELQGIDGLKMPHFPEHNGHSWQAFVTVIDETRSKLTRNDLMERLQSRGISTRPGTHAVHMLSYYRRLMGFNNNDFPNAAALNDYSLAIPLHNEMTEDDFAFVVQSLKDLL